MWREGQEPCVIHDRGTVVSSFNPQCHKAVLAVITNTTTSGNHRCRHRDGKAAVTCVFLSCCLVHYQPTHHEPPYVSDNPFTPATDRPLLPFFLQTFSHYSMQHCLPLLHVWFPATISCIICQCIPHKLNEPAYLASNLGPPASTHSNKHPVGALLRHNAQVVTT